MKPLILEFQEIPSIKSIDYSDIEYSEELNLSVLCGTKNPAIDLLDMETETFTKAEGEGSDSDKSNLQMAMETMTQTYNEMEGSDRDPSRKFKNIQNLLDTTTITESVEETDSDR